MKKEIKKNPYATLRQGAIKAPNTQKNPSSSVTKYTHDARSKAGK